MQICMQSLCLQCIPERVTQFVKLLIREAWEQLQYLFVQRLNGDYFSFLFLHIAHAINLY